MQPIVENTFMPFGSKSLKVKLFKNLLISAVFLAVLIIFFLLKGSEIFTSLDNMFSISSWHWVMGISGTLVIGSMLFFSITTWITYITTRFQISENAIILQSGFFLKKENSFPIRYVSNVSHYRGIIDQLFGVGTCIIEIASDESDAPHADRITLHDMDQRIIESLEDILIKRSHNQRFVVMNK